MRHISTIRSLSLVAALLLVGVVASAAPPSKKAVEEPAPPLPPAGFGPALDSATTFLNQSLDDAPPGLAFAYFLTRRYGVGAFADVPERYDSLLSREPKKGGNPPGAVRLFRRLVDPEHPFVEADLAELESAWDRVTVPALYCDQYEWPASYVEDLERMGSKPGYDVTHAAMALLWMRDNGCDWPVDESVVRSWVDQMASQVREQPLGDISYETAAILRHLGHGDRIPSGYADKVLAAQNDDGGWGFSSERPESHWHPTLLALWSLLEEFASQKADTFVPQAESAPAAPTTAAASAPSPAAWEDMVRTEQRLLDLTPHVSELGRALRNLQLPDERIRPLFGKYVVVTDVGPAEATASPHPAFSRRKTYPIAPTRSEEVADIRLWQSILSDIEWFDYAEFHMVDGAFPEHDPDAFHATASLDARAKLRSGGTAWIRGLVALAWKQDDADAWRITEFQTRRLDRSETPRPAFREVLDVVVDPDVGRRLRASGHDEIVRSFLKDTEAKGTDFFPPAMDEHPGVSVVDLDGDGFDDVYVLAHWGPNIFLRNQGDGTFRDISSQIGLDIAGGTSAAGFGDFDNDGDPDVILARTSSPSLYLRNDGGTFHDASDDVRGVLPRLASSVAIADIDKDGLLDAYISTYAAHELTKDIRQTKGTGAPLLADYVDEKTAQDLRNRVDAGAMVYDFPGPPNVLLRNTGDGKLRVEPESDLAVLANTYQSTWSDFDGDGDPDLYLANDFAPNHLFRNNGDGTFQDVTAKTRTSDVGFGMGATWGDVDDDGREDLYVSNMFSKAGSRITARLPDLDSRFPKMARGNTLFRNRPGAFEDLSEQRPATAATKAGWSWGGQFADVDNDGDLDLHVLSGYYTAPREFELPVDT